MATTANKGQKTTNTSNVGALTDTGATGSKKFPAKPTTPVERRIDETEPEVKEAEETEGTAATGEEPVAEKPKESNEELEDHNGIKVAGWAKNLIPVSTLEERIRLREQLLNAGRCLDPLKV